ncbi:MAG: hypothetical protein C4583_02110 [Anaerolineaceae bacterium]|nr:MAG: hypothetical protein C4583_02110 [Anaerolineaceae bacterium]
MKRSITALATLAFSLTACLNLKPVTAVPNPLAVTPSRPPTILSPTPVLLYPTASITPTLAASAAPSQTSAPEPSATITPTYTATDTFTPSLTASSLPASLEIQLLGCDTGFDLTHGMGEVTNAYVSLINASGLDLTTVCATLSAADEGRAHPDKTACIPSLPNSTQTTLKLTIDTTFQVDTIVSVNVTTNEGIPASMSNATCGEIGTFKPETIGTVQPIP